MIRLIVNGQSVDVDDDPATPLLYVLRDTLELNGPKFGCGLGQCGACSVLLEGTPVFSCLTPVGDIAGSRVTTLEGLGTRKHPSVVQQAFIEEQAAQCGYCTAGMIVRAEALLARSPAPSDAEIRTALEPNLCRCGTHYRIVRAVRRASQARRSGGQAA